jgi:hypothetical protein
VDKKLIPGTSSCVSGLLFNMIYRTVKLISPCNADDGWSLGYHIFEEGRFENINDLKNLLEGMVTRNMPLEVRLNDKVKFREDLEYEIISNGFSLFTRFKAYQFTDASYSRYLGDIIVQGEKTAQEIAECFRWQGIPPSFVYSLSTVIIQMEYRMKSLLRAKNNPYSFSGKGVQRFELNVRSWSVARLTNDL